MSKIAWARYRIPTPDIVAVTSYYGGLLQMTVSKVDPGMRVDEKIVRVHLRNKQSCGLEFFASDGIKPYAGTRREDLYWKIGLALDDVDSVAMLFAENGFRVEPGKQFRDIGFVTHMQDSAGFQIELLQTTFQKNVARRQALIHERRFSLEEKGQPVHPIFQQEESTVAISQITTRTRNAKAAVDFYESLGMRLLVIEDVGRFTLYFLAFTDDEPPSKDPYVEENREWLYQRPYTTLELQEYSGNEPLKQPGNDESGFLGLVISSTAAELERIKKQVNLGPDFHDDSSMEFSVRDPDGLLVTFQLQ